MLRWQAVVLHDSVAFDFHAYQDFGRRFLDTGSAYLPHQLAGPYPGNPDAGPTGLPSLYPPNATLLFAASTFVPAVLWWAIPLGLLAWCIIAWRPAPWAWPVLALILAASPFVTTVMVGNTDMWVAAFIAAGLRWGWGGPLVLMKPTLAPFALAGIHKRGWWAMAGVSVVLGLLMLPEGLRYVQAIVNAETRGLAYSILSVPTMLVPVIAWAARRSPMSRSPVAIAFRRTSPA